MKIWKYWYFEKLRTQNEIVISIALSSSLLHFHYHCYSNIRKGREGSLLHRDEKHLNSFG